jgi:hypothetical protein
MAKRRIDPRKLAAAAAALLLAGCVNFSPLDDLETATPPADAFSQALFKNYSFLAQSFGSVGQSAYTSFDQEGSLPLTQTDLSVATLANTYAGKAMMLTRGEAVDPEPSRDITTHELRDRLVRALTPGRDDFPRDAARAQADWDCWRLNLRASTQAAAAERCRQSFNVTLVRLETETQAMTAQRDAEKAKQKKAEPEKKADSAGPDDGSEMP